MLILAAFLWQLLLTFQGLDLADTGFHLSAFSFIFEDPYSVQYSMMFWLSDVCGNLWMKLNPTLGLYWFKLGWVFFISLSFFLYFKVLQKELGIKQALIGLLVSMIFILRGGPECLNYDIFTTFGFALGTTSLFFGLTKKRFSLLVLSGILIGISIFFKLSNAAGISIVAVIFYWSFLTKKTIKQTIKNAGSWIAGMLLGILLILILIKFVGHWDLFTENLLFLSSVGADSQASHGLKPMLLSYLSGYFHAAVMISIFAAGVFIFKSLSSHYTSKKVQHLLLFVLSSSVVFLSIVYREIFWSKVRYLFIGVMIFQAIWAIINRKEEKEFQLLCFIGLLLLLLAPLGSDSGLGKSVWGMWILGPIVLMRSFKQVHLNTFKLKLSEEQAHFLRKCFLLLVLISATLYAWQNTYFDVGSRAEKFSAIHHPKLKYIYTSDKRADVMNDLIQNGLPLVNEEEYLLSFIEIPMLNYLADKRPFLSTSWPKLYYKPEIFKKKLQEAVRMRKCYPAIIRQKQETKLNDWPSAPLQNYLTYSKKLTQWPEHGKILNAFLKENNYEVTWENQSFQILLTTK